MVRPAIGDTTAERQAAVHEYLKQVFGVAGIDEVDYPEVDLTAQHSPPDLLFGSEFHRLCWADPQNRSWSVTEQFEPYRNTTAIAAHISKDQETHSIYFGPCRPALENCSAHQVPWGKRPNVRADWLKG
jgi:hypothetical protein